MGAGGYDIESTGEDMYDGSGEGIVVGGELGGNWIRLESGGEVVCRIEGLYRELFHEKCQQIGQRTHPEKKPKCRNTMPVGNVPSGKVNPHQAIENPIRGNFVAIVTTAKTIHKIAYPHIKIPRNNPMP